MRAYVQFKLKCAALVRQLMFLYFPRYYKCDGDVKDDFELQNFMNEVSADGTGNDGGLGNVRFLSTESVLIVS